ncbi:unnamed protein product [Rotaria magnacalcarata]|uniref:G-protein coupled receptors family 1 profile domain-containing protein n=2 Tax=Rotaria magnacalcarata TaxID=392030 RepID=A0A8S3BS21_9BILA|nr:unnamed protein product [Rotaria magnacalcarata]
MNSTMNPTNHYAVIPISIISALVGISLACLIIGLIAATKRLHTATYLLICNTCLSSTFYCVVQCNNYIFLNFIVWDTSDMSCQWRAYFTYMSIVAVVYSYLMQAISRYFFVVLSIKYRRVTSLKTHIILIATQWIIVIFVPTPTIFSNSVYYIPSELCWVRMKFKLHVAYTFLFYYFLPTIGIITLYIYLFRRAKHSTNSTFARTLETSRQQSRDNSLFRNIMILFSIYIFGGFPTLLYLVLGNNILYYMGLVFVALAVAVEKAATLIVDRELRNIMKHISRSLKTRVTPVKVDSVSGNVARRNIKLVTPLKK